VASDARGHLGRLAFVPKPSLWGLQNRPARRGTVWHVTTWACCCSTGGTGGTMSTRCAPSPSHHILSSEMTHRHASPRLQQQDATRASVALRLACEENIPESCYSLASHLLRADPADAKHRRDPVKAKALLDLGCGKGHAPSCFNLAVMHKKGDVGIPM
jgi:hypothetical protein